MPSKTRRRRRQVAETRTEEGAPSQSRQWARLSRWTSWQQLALQRFICAFLGCLVILLVIKLFAKRTPLRKLKEAQHTDAHVGKADSLQAPRLVAVGDLHGDLQQAKRVLELMDIVDITGAWIGGDTVIVQTGDLLDRGPNSIEVVRLFRKLKTDAAASGGRLVMLMGNHELMNLLGAFFYVSVEELAALGARTGGIKLTARQLRELDNQPWYNRLGLENMDQKRGAVIWRKIMEPGGWLGDVLRHLPVAEIVGEGPCKTLFVHGGITDEMLQPFMSSGAFTPTHSPEDVLERMNKAIWAAVAGCPGGECRSQEQGLLLGPDGITWYRGYHTLPESTLCSQLEPLLDALRVQRVVVGHSIQEDLRIRSRCHSRLHLIDVGMSRAYFGALAGWVCSEGKTFAVYDNHTLIRIS